MKNLVSKQDLLKEKNISYGQLYRWKRMGLIPENWFKNMPTKTGQETFFEKDQIYKRIDKIGFLRKEMTLMEMKSYFKGGVPEDIRLRKEEILNLKILSPEILKVYDSLYIKDSGYRFLDLLYIYIGSDLHLNYDINVETVFKLIKEIDLNYKKLKEFNFKISIYKKLGIVIPVLHIENSIYFFDGDIVLKDYDIKKCVNKLKKELENKANENKSK